MHIGGEDLINFMSMLGYMENKFMSMASDDIRYHHRETNSENLFEFPIKMTRYEILKAHNEYLLEIGYTKGKAMKAREIREALDL